MAPDQRPFGNEFAPRKRHHDNGADGDPPERKPYRRNIVDDVAADHMVCGNDKGSRDNHDPRPGSTTKSLFGGTCHVRVPIDSKRGDPGSGRLCEGVNRRVELDPAGRRQATIQHMIF